jgi:hypothetical protein
VLDPDAPRRYALKGATQAVAAGLAMRGREPINESDRRVANVAALSIHHRTEEVPAIPFQILKDCDLAVWLYTWR